MSLPSFSRQQCKDVSHYLPRIPSLVRSCIWTESMLIPGKCARVWRGVEVKQSLYFSECYFLRNESIFCITWVVGVVGTMLFTSLCIWNKANQNFGIPCSMKAFRYRASEYRRSWTSSIPPLLSKSTSRRALTETYRQTYWSYSFIKMIALTLLSSVVLSAPAQTVQALASPLSEFESWTVQFSKSYSNTVSALKRRARVFL